MQLLDQIKCVECGKVEYKRSSGKSSRTFFGVCDRHQGKLFEVSDGVSKEIVPEGKSEVVQAGKPGKG